MRHSLLAVPFLPAAAVASELQDPENVATELQNIVNTVADSVGTGTDAIGGGDVSIQQIMQLVTNEGSQNFWQLMDIPDYGKIFSETGFDVFQQLVNLNKLLIELIDSSLEHVLHMDTNGFGLSLILYTCLIKSLIYPLYEGQLRSTARMRKVQPMMREIQIRHQGD